jgi:hypothetical protein
MTETSETGLVLNGTTMPSARNVSQILRDQLHGGVLAERARRGETRQPEDFFPMQRSLAAVVDVAKEYEYAFRQARKEAEAIAEEELIDAVGEQDGQPNQALSVPDAEGDLRIVPQVTNSYEIDPDSIMSAVAFSVLFDREGGIDGMFEEHGREAEEQLWERREATLAELLVEAQRVLCTLGKFDPQVSKVRAFAKELARMPDGDGVSATVTGAVKKTTDYKGVKIERKK